MKHMLTSLPCFLWKVDTYLVEIMMGMEDIELISQMIITENHKRFFVNKLLAFEK